jgi:repressor LexA
MMLGFRVAGLLGERPTLLSDSLRTSYAHATGRYTGHAATGILAHIPARRKSFAKAVEPPMNRPLTNQQQAVYDFIRDKIMVRGYGPTVREIGEHMNIKSPNGVMCHLRALERKGMIVRTANKSRAIELTEPISRLIDAKLPISGSIAAGVCLISSESSHSFDLSSLLAANDRYGLRIQDDSLVAALICKGDLVVVQPQSHAAAGQLAIVRTGDAETCLRFWIPEGGRIRLQPPLRSLPPTIVDRAEVLGVVVAVIRSLLPQPPLELS